MPRALVGLVMDDKGVLRHGQRVLTASGDGEILSGTFSPTLGKVDRVRARAGRRAGRRRRSTSAASEVPVRVVKYPFVRDGKPLRRHLSAPRSRAPAPLLESLPRTRHPDGVQS